MRARALKLLAFVPLAVCLMSRNISGAGQKVNGTTVITDDQVLGTAATIGARDGGFIYTLDGSLGSLGSMESDNASGAHVESGYFTHRTSTPVFIGQPSVWITSMSVTFENNNPEGTVYVFQVSTASDFTGDIFSGPAPMGFFSSTITGLSPGVTYYTAVTALYGEQDQAVTFGGSEALQNYCGPMSSVGGGGPWSLPSTWDVGFPPTNCAQVDIQPAHVVTVDITTATASTTTVMGTLEFSRSTHSALTMVGGDMIVEPGGHLDMGTAASPLPLGTSAHLVLAYGSGSTRYGLTIKNGGDFTVRGATKTPWGYAVDDTLGAVSSFQISASSAINWAAGDTVTIGPTTGNGPSSVDERIITSITGTDPLTINLDSALSGFRDNTATSPIIAANLTRNVLVRSSGTDTSAGGDTAYITNLAENTTSFNLVYGEFAYIGANVAGKYAITFDGANVRGEISSSTVRGGYRGIVLNGADNNTLAANNVYSNSSVGIYLNASANNTLTGNNSYSNSSYGISLFSSSNNTLTGNNSYANSIHGIFLTGSSNNTLTGNNSYSNSSSGIFLDASSNNTLTGNNSYSNSNFGIYLFSSSNNTFTGNNSYSNSSYGIHLDDSSNNTFTGNNSYANSIHGIFLTGSSNNTLTGNNSYSNSSFGIYLWSSANNTLTGNNSYSNSSYGIYLSGSSNNTFAGGSLGYDSAGNDLPNTTAEIFFNPGGSAETLTLKGVRVNPALGIDVAGLDQEGAYLVSYNQNYATGTIRLYGHLTLSATNWYLDDALQLYTSTATAPKLMRGSGHSAQICGTLTDDADALSQLITLEYDGAANWDVTGSSTGAMGSVTAAGGCQDVAGQFQIDVAESSPAQGDSIDFVLIAASKDAGRQKQLLFGPGASGFNDGRSKLILDNTAGIVFRGKSDGTANTLIDILPGSTYFLFVSSGQFTAEFSSFTNMGPGGIQLAGPGPFALDRSTFDYLGFFGGTNTYITGRDLTSTAVFDEVTFNLSRSSYAYDSAYNVRLEGDETGVDWTFTNFSGEMAGEGNDSEAGNRVVWVLPPPPGCTVGYTVEQAGNKQYVSIQEAVDALPQSLPGHACVMIADGAVYAEQVTVSGFINNGSSITIFADPLSGLTPIVSPGAGNTAAFKVVNASVNIFGIDIVPTDAMPYGVLVSSAYVSISSVNVQDAGGQISVAGISLSSWNTVSHTSVTVLSAHGFSLPGSTMTTVSYSSAQTNAASFNALYINGGDSNTITNSFISNPSGNGAYLAAGADYNAIANSTVTSNGVGTVALYINDSDSNTVTNSFISNPVGYGAYLTGGADHNIISNSIITSNHSSYRALWINNSDSNTVTNSVISNPAGDSALLNGSDYNTIANSTITSNGAGYLALWIVNADSNTVTNSFMSNPVGYGALLDGADYNIISNSTMTSNGVSYPALFIYSNSDSNTVTDSFMSNPNGYGARLEGSDYNTIANSTMTGNHASYRALYILNGDSNTVTNSYISNPAGDGAYLSGADYNTISNSTMISDGTNARALFIADSDSNTVTSSFMSNPNGFGAALLSGADYNTITKSTVTSGAACCDALHIQGSSSNTVTNSFIFSSLGDGFYLALGADYNTISNSTMTSNGTNKTALFIGDSDSNIVTNSFMANPAGNAVALRLGADYNTISNSTMTSNAVGNSALYIDDSSTNTIAFSYIRGSTAVFITGSTGTIINSSVLVAADAAGDALWLAGGSVNLAITSTTLAALPGGRGLALGEGNSGELFLSSVVVTGAGYGMYFTTQAAGFSLNVDSITFRNLAAGTAIHFAGGTFVATFTLANFEDSGVAINVNAAPLDPASRITMRSFRGPRAGMVYEIDPNSLVDWGPPPANPTLDAIFLSSISVSWGDPNAGQDGFVVEASSTNFDGSGIVYSSATTNAALLSLTPQSLDANTTYYLRAGAIYQQTTSYVFTTPVSSSTLANPVANADFYMVGVGSVTVNWTPLPAAPQEETAEGYVLEASTASDFTGTVYSSSTADVSLSTLTVTLGPSTTYYFRVGSLNWNGTANYGGTGSTRTYGWYSAWTSPELEATTRVAWGDFDNDGDLDFAASNSNQNNRVYRNNGDGSFTSVWDDGLTENTVSMVWGDYDNDGDLDLAVGNYNQSNRVYRNNGDDSFTSVWSSAETERTFDVAWGDYDNDGDLDLAVANYDSQTNRVYRNNGDDTFTPVWNSVENEFTQRIAWADTDNDGDLDLIVANAGGQPSRGYRNDGGGNFSLTWTSAETEGTQGLALGDLDNDGDVDLVLGNGASQGVRVYKNDGTGVFASWWVGSGDSTTGIALGDFDNDGDLDLAAANGVVGGQPNRVYSNNGDATFTSVWTSVESEYSTKVAWGDVNNDGNLDLVVANANGNVTNRVYLGFLPTKNSTPTAPGGLSASFVPGAAFATDVSTLTFKWEAGDYDSNGSTESVSYALVVTTVPMTLSADEHMVVYPSSAVTATFTFTWTEGSPLLGKYLRPAYKIWPGDALPSHGVILSTTANLPGSPLQTSTTYFYRVQAIDAGLGRSSWSLEASIYVVGPCDPRISITDGDWSAAATWNTNSPPTNCSPVIITLGDTVTVNGGAVASSVTITGTLKFHRTISSTLSVVAGDITVEPDGYLDMGSFGDAIGAGVEAHLILAKGSTPAEFGLIVKDGGDFTVYGPIKSAASLLSGNVAAIATVNLADDPGAMGWQVGDRVTMGPAQTLGKAAIEERTITSLGVNQITVDLSFLLTYLASETVHIANITRNVLIRSSGTDFGADTAYVRSLVRNATSFQVVSGEFAYLGANVFPFYGVVAKTLGEFLDISSSAIHHGWKGVVINDSGTLTYNVIYANQLEGVDATGADFSTISWNYVHANSSHALSGDAADFVMLEGNAVYGNDREGFRRFGNNSTIRNNDVHRNGGIGINVGGDGLLVENNTVRHNGGLGVLLGFGVDNVDLFNNVISSNNGFGILVNSDANWIRGNDVQANANYGVLIQTDSNRNVIELNTVRDNANTGIRVYGSSRTIILNNYVSGNLGHGVELVYSTRSYSGNNTYANNAGDGIRVDRTQRIFLMNEFSHGNSQNGIWQISADETEYYGGGLGTDSSGVSDPNGLREVEIGAGGTGTFLYMQDVDIDGGDVRISTAGLDAEDKSMASSNQTGDIGSLRLWGTINFDNKPFVLDYNQLVFVSTVNQTPVLIRGAGHSANVDSTDDDEAISQIISIVFDASVPEWRVEGSSSGLMYQSAVSFSNQPIPVALPQFVLDFSAGPSPVDGDRVVFPLLGSTKDVGQQKKLLFGPRNSSVHQGRSKLILSQDSGPGSLTLRGGGSGGQETIVDMLPGGTYYHFVASAPLTIEHAIIWNTGPFGIEISSTSSVFMSSTTFDFMGIAGGTNTYITLRGLNEAATFYGVNFGVSRSTLSAPSAYNVFLDPAYVSKTTWTFRRWSGALGGEDNDSSESGSGRNSIAWSPFSLSAPALLAVYETSATASWSDPFNDPGVVYNLEASSSGYAAGTLTISSTTPLLSATVSGLLTNTTYFLRVSAVEVGTSPYVSISTVSTLASVVVGAQFSQVDATTITVNWQPHPAAPQEFAAEGYVVDASTAPDFSGQVFSSSTFSGVEPSTLSLSGLTAGVTYYFRVGSLNWVRTTNYLFIGSTRTATPLPVNPIVGSVSLSSITVSWGGVNPDGGYVLEASTAADFTGTLDVSSITYIPGLTTLTVEGLSLNTTYYLQAGSVWNGATYYALVTPLSTATLVNDPSTAAPIFLEVHFSSISIQWGAGTPANPAGTRFVLEASTAADFTGTADVSSDTLGLDAFTTGLLNNTTYYARVRAFNHNGIPSNYVLLGATATRINPPTAIIVDHITSTSIVVAAYAPTPDFRNLHAGLSGTEIEMDGGTLSGFKGSAWTVMAVMPGGGRHSLAAAAVGERIFAFGGQAGASHVQTNEMFSPPPFNAWASTTAMPPLSRSKHGAAVAEGRIYSFGGYRGTYLNFVDEYDPETQAWTSKAPLSGLRRGMAAVTVGSRTYVIGGRDNTNTLVTTHQVYVSTADAWVTGAPLVPARELAAGVAFGDKVYVIGGDGGGDLNVVSIFDPLLNSWGSGSAMPTARQGVSASVIGGKIYVFGGTSGGTPLSLTEEYDPVADAWAERVPMITTRSLTAAAVVEGKAYVIGGDDGPSDLAVVEEFDPGTSHVFGNLLPNSPHFFEAQARNIHGITSPQTSLSFLVITLAAVPSTHTPTFTMVGVDSVTVQWTSNATLLPADFQLQVSTDSSFTDAGALKYDSGFVTEISDIISDTPTGLSGNTTHFFRVRARNSNNIETIYRLVGTTVTQANPPSSPVLSLVETSSAAFSWNSNSNGPATLYEAQVSTTSSFDGTADGATSTIATSQIFGAGSFMADLLADTTYYFRARALNLAGAPTLFTTAIDTITLAFPPENSTAAIVAVNVGSITFMWNNIAPGINPIDTFYAADISTDSSFGSISISTGIKDLITAFGPPGAGPALETNTTYYLRVRAINRGGTPTENAATITQASLAAPPLFPAPFATVDLSSITLQWDANSNPLGTLYQVDMSTWLAPPFNFINLTTFTYSTAVLFGTGGLGNALLQNTTHLFRVQAVGHSGNFTGFETVLATATKVEPPVAGAPPFLNVAFSSLTFVWSGGGNPPSTLYDAELSTTPAFDGQNDVSSTTANTAVIFGTNGAGTPLLLNTTYYLQVRAGRVAGGSTTFTAAQATATWVVAPADSYTFFNVEKTSAAVMINALPNPTGTLVEVQVSTEDASFNEIFSASFTVLNNVLFGATGEPPDLLANATHWFRMRAINHGNIPSSWTVVRATVTNVNEPDTPAVASVTSASLSFTWGSGGNAPGTDYLAEVSTDGFTSINLSSNTKNQFIDVGLGGLGLDLTPNTSYYLHVQAINLGGSPTVFTPTISTITLAAIPSTTTFVQGQVDFSSITFSYQSANPLGTTYYVQISSDDFTTFNLEVSTLNLSVLFGPQGVGQALLANATYYFRALAINDALTRSTWSVTSTTFTPAAAPISFAPEWPSVGITSITWQWDSNGNRPGTQFIADVSTDNFGSTSHSIGGVNTFVQVGSGGAAPDLIPNSTYYFRVQTEDIHGNLTPLVSALFSSTFTFAATPGAAPDRFLLVEQASATIAWLSNGNSTGTVYEAELSTSPAFDGAVDITSITLNLDAHFPALLVNTTYYAQVRVQGRNGIFSPYATILPTATLSAPPASTDFLGVFITSADVGYTAGASPVGTLHEIQISTDGFVTLAASSRTIGLSAIFGQPAGFGPALTSNATYYARVRTINHNSVPSTWTLLASTITNVNTPGVAAQSFPSVNADDLTFDWANGGNAAGTDYLAQISTDSAFGTLTNSSNTKNLSAIFGTGGLLPALDANATYYLRVQAINVGGSASPFAAWQTTTTLAFQPAPAAAEYPAMTAEGLAMAWSNGGNPPSVRYVAEISSVSTFDATGDISSNTLNLGAVFGALGEGGNLTPNTSYYTRVRALNRVGTPSAPLVLSSTVTRVNIPGFPLPPFGPVEALSITVLWTQSLNPTDTVFETQISNALFGGGADGSSTTLANSMIFGAGGVLPALVPDTTYYFQVRAFARDGTPSIFGATISTVTPPATPDFGVPASLFAVEVSSISYLWSANGNLGGTDYEAQISTDNFNTVNLSSITKNVSVLFGFGGVLPALSADTSYYFQVRAIGKGGTPTPFAASTNVFTLADIPQSGAPSFPNVAVASLTYVWAAGANRVGTNYELQVSTEANFATLNDTFATQAVSLDVGQGGAGQPLAGNATYYFRVRAVNQDGIPSDYQLVGSTFTIPAVPGTAAVEFTTVEASSITFEWTANGNRPGTDYFVEVSSDDYASLVLTSTTKNVSLLAGSGGAGAPLSANTTYYFRVAPFNVHGDTQSLKTAVSTVTLVAPPLNLLAPFAAVNLDSIDFGWDPNGNGPGTDYVARISTESNFASINITSTTKNNSVLFGAGGALPALNRNTTYYFQVQALTVAGTPTPFTTGVATHSLVAIPDLAAPATTFANVFTNSLVYEWGANGNPAGTDYLVEFALNPIFSPLDRSSFTKSTSALFGTGGEGADLTLSTTFYLRVRAINIGGWSTAFTTVESTRTLPGDIYPPTIVDNQAGDAAWRRANTGVYDVDFDDFGGSQLDRFEVKTSTTSGDVIGGTWTVVNPPGGGINLVNYSADWLLPATIFADMIEGTTNYVSVRAFDGNANMSAAAPGQDVFFVQKDTTPPIFVNAEAGGDSVPQSAAGKFYDVDVRDPASGIAAFEYSASTTPVTVDQSRIPWTAIAIIVGTGAATTDWTVDFAALLNDATNYISVRAWDIAGDTATVDDAFFIMKDTGGPTVAITLPTSGGIFISSLPVIQGTASDFLGVQGAEVSFRDNDSGFCWDGAGFTSLCPFFFPATGTVSWAYSQSIPLVGGGNYDIVARASDTAGNYSTNYSTLTNITFDNVLPAGGLEPPFVDTFIGFLPQISGTALDADAGVAAVEVRIQRKTDGMYWNWFTETWSVVGVSTSPTGVAAWFIDPTETLRSNLEDNTSYFIGVRVTDNAQPANQIDFFVAGATFTFVDPGPPDAVTNLSALTGGSPGEIELSWTAPGDDPGGVGTILFGEFRIQHSTFTPVTFASMSAQVIIPTGTVVPATTRRYTLGSLLPNATHYLRIWTKDDAGNWSPVSNGATTYAAPPLFNEIQGHVMNASSQGITAVLVEAFDASDVMVASAFTVADGSGTWTLTSVPTGVYRVQATWTVDQISSAVWIDGVAMGSTNVDFVLNLTYTLSTLQGSMAGLGTAGGASPSFMSVAASDNFTQSKVELFQNGRLAATAIVDASGKWVITGLLPGKYGVRAFNGLEYTLLQEIDLLEGEIKTVSFVFDPLPEGKVFAFPNPARGQTTIRFVTSLLPFEAQIRIFDIAGSLVREIPGSALTSPSPALYHAVWDLKNGSGADVASGVYLFIVKVKGANGQSAKVIKKLAVVR